MLEAWQHLPEHLNPIALNIEPIQVSWYGIMYIVAFAVVYYLVRYRIQTEKLGISFEAVQDFFPWAIVGLLLGARLGDVFIYDWGYFQNHLSQIFLPFDIENHWQYIGIYGMSYFGGLIGLVIAFFLFCRIKNKYACHREERSDEAISENIENTGLLRYARNDSEKKISLLRFSDLFVPAVPLAFAFGRLGNFINGELYGRITTRFLGMYFPADFSGQLRHPSQLYEMFLEGILLFIILWSIRKIKFPVGYLTAFYLIGYGLTRFTSEFFRQPDNGWYIFSLTIGQLLSILIIIIGLIITSKSRKKYGNKNPKSEIS